uniref:Uncharacterized protein n=1 Tax=viral metagenome TaxID=1070528 RepID=A0A6M3JQT4_9ZZZZ
MLIIMAVLADGYMFKCGVVDNTFDIQKWAQSRLSSFKLLNIVRLELIEI